MEGHTDDRLMLAAVTFRHGGPDATEIRSDWAVPVPGPGEALVRVTAAALNNTDLWTREGRYGSADDPEAIAGWRGVPIDFPLIQGIDVCGTVAEVGPGEDSALVGRRVLIDPIVDYDRRGFPARLIANEVDGGFAEYHRCGLHQLHDVSGSPLSDAQLACLPTAYGTAVGMINRAECQPGERVLVTGASGGVGSAAVQLLRNRGCQVVARTSPGKEDRVRSLGAHEVSCRGQDPLHELGEVDVVVEVVGGAEFGSLVNCLRDGGRMVVAGAIAGPVVELDLRRLYLPQRRLIGSTMHTGGDFSELASLALSGAIRPEVAAVYSLAELHRAQDHFLSKNFTGKLVVTPPDRAS